MTTLEIDPIVSEFSDLLDHELCLLKEDFLTVLPAYRMLGILTMLRATGGATAVPTPKATRWSASKQLLSAIKCPCVKVPRRILYVPKHHSGSRVEVVEAMGRSLEKLLTSPKKMRGYFGTLHRFFNAVDQGTFRLTGWDKEGRLSFLATAVDEETGEESEVELVSAVRGIPIEEVRKAN